MYPECEAAAAESRMGLVVFLLGEKLTDEASNLACGTGVQLVTALHEAVTLIAVDANDQLAVLLLFLLIGHVRLPV